MPWHVAHVSRSKWINARDGLLGLPCVDDVMAPHRVEQAKLHGRPVERAVPWLGPLILASWPSDDPHAWHDIVDLPHVLGIIGGWPPAQVPQHQVDRLVETIHSFDDKTAQPIGEPPCAPNDIVRFTHLAFYRLTAKCVWVSDPLDLLKPRQVGLRIGMLGRDDIVIPVPWSAIERPRTDGGAPQYGRRRA